MRPNRMLVRHGDPDGWTLVAIDPGDRPVITAFHNVPHLTKVEAVKETTDLLNSLADEFAYRIGVDPSGDGDVPGDDYWLGDVVEVAGDELRAMGFTLALDTQRPGRMRWVPEVGQVVDPPNVRQATINQRFNTGSADGRSRVARPLGQVRGQSVGDAPASTGCCTHVFQGRAGGSVGASSVEDFEPAAPVGGAAGYLYDPAVGPDVIGEGAWQVGGHFEIEFAAPAAGGLLTVSGSNGAGVILGRATVPAGVDTWEVPFAGGVWVAGGAVWAPVVSLNNGVATAIDSAVVYFTAQGSCACRHEVTESV